MNDVVLGDSYSRYFTVRNYGSQYIDDIIFNITGPHAADFTVTGASSNLYPGDMPAFPIVFTPSGTGARTATLQITSGDPSGAFTIHLIGTGITQMDDWRLSYFGTTSQSGNLAATASYMNDGVSNFMKFATGLNPLQSNGRNPGSASRSGNNVLFTYNRSKAAVTGGVQFIVEWSDTLVDPNWNSVGVTESTQDNGNTEAVTATLPAGPLGQRFVQLRVVGNP